MNTSPMDILKEKLAFCTEEQLQQIHKKFMIQSNAELIEIAINYRVLYKLLVDANVNKDKAHEVAFANMYTLRDDYSLLFHQFLVLNILDDMVENKNFSINPEEIHAIRMVYRSEKRVSEFNVEEMMKALNSRTLFNGKSVPIAVLENPMSQENKKNIKNIGTSITKRNKAILAYLKEIAAHYPITKNESSIVMSIVRASEYSILEKYGMSKATLLAFPLPFIKALREKLEPKSKVETKDELIPEKAKEIAQLNRLKLMTAEEVKSLYSEAYNREYLFSMAPLTEAKLTYVESQVNIRKVAQMSEIRRKELYGLSFDELKEKRVLTHDTLEILKLIQRTSDERIKEIFGTTKEKVLRQDNLTLDYILSLKASDLALPLLKSHDEKYHLSRLTDGSIQTSLTQREIIEEHKKVLSELESMTQEEAETRFAWKSKKKIDCKDYPLSYLLLQDYERRAIINRLNTYKEKETEDFYGIPKRKLINDPYLSYDKLGEIIATKTGTTEFNSQQMNERINNKISTTQSSITVPIESAPKFALPMSISPLPYPMDVEKNIQNMRNPNATRYAPILIKTC